MQRGYVIFEMTKCESAQCIVILIINRFKHRMASCPMGYNEILEM